MTSDFEEIPPYKETPKRRSTDGIMPKADLSDPSIHTAKILRRWLRAMVALTLVLYVIVGVIAVATYLQGNRNTQALCTIRKNASDRVEQTQQFLRDNPSGIQGVTPLDLRRSIVTYQNTVRALSEVDCPPEPVP